MNLSEFIKDDWEYADWPARACIVLFFPLYVLIAMICLFAFGDGEY